jgi:cell division topological specificity factor
MNLLASFSTRRSASVARDRLQILLTHERRLGGQSDLLTLLREEVLAVIAKHIEVEPDDVHITLERGEEISLLEIDVELPIKALDEDH